MKIPILMYHMISDSDHPPEKKYCCSPNNFKKQMWYIKVSGYTPVTLEWLAEYFGQTLSYPEKPVIITFDDGFKDNYENALPVLKKYKFPATVFVVSDLVGSSNLWTENEGYPKRLLMGWREINDMQKHGITIGSHTLSHPRLSLLKQKDAKREVEDSKRALEDKLGVNINHFAYPYGDMNESIVDMIKEAGYRTACSTRSGFNSEKVSLFELRRLDIYGTDSLLQFAIKLTYGTNDGNLFLPIKYYIDRLTEMVN